MLSSTVIAQDSPVNYDAKDSIIADMKNQIVRLYGEANVNYDDFALSADYIEIDLSKNEVIATYTTDENDSIVGKPVFTVGGETSSCDYMKYNFKTEKGYIREVRAQQDEGYIHMAESKRHPNDEIHLKNGKFTTCDKENPHYHFKLTKAIIVPDKRIVTGPVFMKLWKIPLPLGAPFAFFPNTTERKHGIILPSYANSAQYGFGLQDFGYYIPLGESWDTRFYATGFTTGTFGLENATSYYRKYKSRGDFSVKYEQFQGRFYDTTLTTKWTLRWKHAQDSKAHPTLKFSTDINFVSDNNGKSSLETVNQDYFNNTFNSSINATKSWKLRPFSGTIGAKASLQQSTVTGNYTMDLPSLNLSVARFDLGVLRGRKAIGESFLDKINVTYTMNGQNRIVAPDSIFSQSPMEQLPDYMVNGIKHSTNVVSNLRLFGGRMTFTPSVRYNEIWNFQYEDREWNDAAEKIDTSDLKGFRASRDIATSGTITSNFFGYYRMLGKRKIRFRHVATPTASFTYRPDIGIYEEIQSDTTGNTITYSPFANSMYREGSSGNSAFISFGLNNTLELKRKDLKDTINETTKSLKLIDAATINGSYDFLKDSFNLSDFALQLRTSRFLNIFSFQSSATWSPYSYDIEGVKQKEYAWEVGQGAGRITRGTLALTANFTNKTGRKKQKEVDQATSSNAILNANATSGQQVNFDIPWQLNLSYNINYNRSSITNIVTDTKVDSFTLVQTLRADGDFNINRKWKVGASANYDLQSGAFTNYNLSIWRDLHCWEATFQFGQIGKIVKGPNGEWVGTVGGEKIKYWQQSNFTFLFRVNIKASIFQDIKLEWNQPPFFN